MALSGYAMPSSWTADMIFARDSWLKKAGNEDIATKFLVASYKGWIYCRDNQSACVNIVLRAGSKLGSSHQAWQLNEINGLIAQAKGISFDVQKTQAAFEQLYPRQYTTAVSSDRMVQDATARWDNTYQALKQTLVIQATIASALDQDGQTLRTLMANSSGAVGSLQAQQSGNELLALQIKQSLQAQTLVATQARADALRAAEQQASAQAARERFTRFIGDGHAYLGGK